MFAGYYQPPGGGGNRAVPEFSGVQQHYELGSLAWESGGHSTQDASFEEMQSVAGFSESGTPRSTSLTGGFLSGGAGALAVFNQNPLLNGARFDQRTQINESQSVPGSSGKGLYLHDSDVENVGVYVKIFSGSVTGDRTLTLDVADADKILNIPLQSGQLGSGSVHQAAIASGVISSTKLSLAAVFSGNVASGQIGWPHITSGAVYGVSGIVVDVTGSGIRISIISGVL